MSETKGICPHGKGWGECPLPHGTSNIKGGTVSVADDTMDQMIQRASTPNLAMLFRRGQQAGLLQPGKAYGEG